MDNMSEFRIKALPAGMTLVEMLVTLVLLAIGFLAIMNLQIATMKQGAMANELTIASFLAESKIERLQALVRDYESVKSEPLGPEYLTMDGASCEQSEEGCVYTRTATVIAGFPTSRSYEVSVTVEWAGKVGITSATFDTVVSAVGF